MNTSDLADRYQLLHLVHQGYLGALWASRGHTGDAAGSPALVRRIQLPAGLREDQQVAISEAAWDSLEISHDCVLKVGEVVFAEGVFAIAYDYLDAEVLQALLLMGTVRKTPLAPDVVARILLDVVEGLQAVARDTRDMDINSYGGVTPESIVVGSDGRARLIDTVIGAVASGVPLIRAHANRVGYCSPEQLKGQPVDERSDVFSLGILLAELLAGRRFLLGAASAIEQKIVAGKLPRVHGWLKPERGIDAKLLDVLDRAIAVDRDKRPASLQALADEVCAGIAAPASRAQVGAAVYALAAKQLEVRGRKLALNSGPRLSERVASARAPRSSPRVQLPATAPAQADLKAPRAVDTRSMENEAPTLAPAKADAETPSGADISTPKAPEVEALEPKADSQRETAVGVEPRSKMGTFPGLAPPPATLIGGHAAVSTNGGGKDIDDLLGELDEPPARSREKREDMQSGTHRKVLTTLIGVAPPPRPNIGGPPPLAIPTNVAVVSAPLLDETAATSSSTVSGARDAAGIADLLRTAVPSRRPEAGGSRPLPEATAPAISPPKGAKVSIEQARDPISVALATDPPLSGPPEQLERYRRLTILLGATTVLLLTLLCWIVLDDDFAAGAGGQKSVAPAATTGQHVRPTPVTPAASAGVREPAPRPSSEQVEEVPAASTASAVAEEPKTQAPQKSASGAKATPKATTAPRKTPKKKIFVPDGI